MDLVCKHMSLCRIFHIKPEHPFRNFLCKGLNSHTSFTLIDWESNINNSTDIFCKLLLDYLKMIEVTFTHFCLIYCVYVSMHVQAGEQHMKLVPSFNHMEHNDRLRSSSLSARTLPCLAH